jgi:quercetin dioxygenase-like cupin family protein
MLRQVLYTIFLSAALSIQVIAQDTSIFSKGEIATVDNHTGTVWLRELSEPDRIFNYSIAVATFEPGAKLDWHIHPDGQILLITEGTGYYQERGKPGQTVRKGDVIKCLPNVEHWHGASPQSGFAYIGATPAQKGKTIWLKRVTDEEYQKAATASPTNNKNAKQEVINLSKEKWRWMAEKKADTLAGLFHENAVFVHMGGSWGKDQELNVIKSGSIHYKQADILETSVKFIGKTAILLNRIKLLAVVGGNEVTNPFMVTEVYVKENGKWMLGSLSFTRLMGQ